MRDAKAASLRRRVAAVRASNPGVIIDNRMGMKHWNRMLRQGRRYALPAQKWPGKRRVFLEGTVLRPASYRSALRRG